MASSRPRRDCPGCSRNLSYSRFRRQGPDSLCLVCEQGGPKPRGEHSLSGLDEQTKFALCSSCGPVRVYLTSTPGRKSSWACSKSVLAARRRAHLLKAYGLTVEQYDEMMVGQGGVCAVCSRECPSGRRLAVDHCHDTGKVRALLCTPCNTMLGRADDSIELLESLAAYLRAHEAA